MSRRPVAPGCSLIKTNIVTSFLPFSNPLFIYLFVSFHLFSLTGTSSSVPEKEALIAVGVVTQGKTFPSVSEIAAIWTTCLFYFLIFAPFMNCFPGSLCVFFFFLMLPRWKNWQWLGVGFDIQKPPLEGFDWLRGRVAMVKAVIKAIKAAGVGLNGSSDCLRCHKLNRKGDVKQGRTGQTWKVR